MALQADSLEQSGAPRRIRVPGPWHAQFEDLRESTGVACYRLRLALPAVLAEAGTSNALIVLHFGAVDYHTSVWLNGRLLISTCRLQEHLEIHPVATIMLRDRLVRLA